MASPYEIPHPDDIEDPDFSYKSENKEEELYVLGFLALLSAFYTKYKDKSADYTLKNIDKDIKKFEEKAIKNTDKLIDIFNNKANTALQEAGILKQNLKKIDLSNIKPSKKTDKTVKQIEVKASTISPKDSVKGAKKVLKHRLESQNNSLKSISNELKYGIKAKANNLIDRNSPEMFDIRPNVKRISNRLKSSIEYNYRSVEDKAKRKTGEFLYDDPLAYWITKGDKRVCKFCLAVENESPMPMSRMPVRPLHQHCGRRCRVEYADDLKVTEDAVNLFYEDIDY